MLTLVEFCVIVLLMVAVFRVPIHGTFLTLLAIACRSSWRCSAWACAISTKANTTDEAGQMAMGTVMPSIFLSGYVFPLDSMPRFFR